MTDDTGRSVAEGALFTDQYQLSMAQLYFHRDLHLRNARFDYFFRTYPDYGRHQAGYCIAAGLSELLEWMGRVRFTDRDLDLLRSQRSAAGHPVFGDEFLAWLGSEAHFGALEVDAVAEGRVIHAHTPVVSVRGPLAVAQLLETSLLNHLNYPTLIATKAARVVAGARGGSVLEFGMRRGPGFAVNPAARAALIGGADFTSNVGLSHLVGLPPRGTHAHSMVQVFMAMGEGELAAFHAYAERYPDDCVLLVDTIDTLESGVPNAIAVFEDLRRKGHEPQGIRLDSGDLAYLAIRSARLLDDAGFPDVSIVLSSDLDELVIWQILTQIDEEAAGYGVDPERLVARMVYGVGTRLITSHGHGALDGVYKLTAVADASGVTRPAIKVSDTAAKIPIPGPKRVWRLYDERGAATADLVAAPAETIEVGVPIRIFDVNRPEVGRSVVPAEVEELVTLVWVDGRSYADGTLDSARRRCRQDLDRLDPGVRRLVNPHRYHVSMTAEIRDLRNRMVSDPEGRAG